MAALGAGACSSAAPTQRLGAETFNPRTTPLDKFEAKADCAGLARAMMQHAVEVKTQQAAMKKEMATAPPNLARMFERSSAADGRGTKAFDEIQTERRTMAAINARLVEKGCPRMDIERAIADAAGPAAKPCPTPASRAAPAGAQAKKATAPAEKCG